MNITRRYHEMFFSKRLSIFLYHGIVKQPLETGDWGFIDEPSFGRQMKYLRRYFDVVHLSDALDRMLNGREGRPVAAVTFDDGFRNNYDIAFPILLKYGLPVTIFLSTGLINTSDTTWACRLNIALSGTRASSIKWDGECFDLSTPDMKARAANSIKAGLKRLPQPRVVSEMRRLVVDLGQDPYAPVDRDSPFRMLDGDAIGVMWASGLVRFGAHTHSHAILSLLSRAEQEKEIRRSIDSVSGLTGTPCECFAYPNGRQQDYDALTIKILRACGVKIAVTTMPASNDARTSPLELSRYGMGPRMPLVKFHLRHLHSVEGRPAGVDRRHRSYKKMTAVNSLSSRINITYYDFSDIYYSSFFLYGFLQNQKLHSYKFKISKQSPVILSDPSMDAKWRNILYSVCLFKINTGDEEYYFCIDARDSNNTTNGMGYHLPLLEKVKYYYKVNYNLAEIENDPNLRGHSDKIIPVPLFFPVRIYSPRISPKLLPCKDMNWTTRDAVRRIMSFLRLLPLNEIKQMRQIKKDIDIFFVTTYYDAKKPLQENEFRLQLMKEIKKNKKIKSIVGFAKKKGMPDKYADFGVNEYNLRNYLSNISRAKIAIYVRGVYGCVSFKLGQLLCMGMPIIGQSIVNNKNMLYENAFFHEQFAFDDPEEIVYQASKMLNKPDRLTEIGLANALTFDTKFAPEKITFDILNSMLG